MATMVEETGEGVEQGRGLVEEVEGEVDLCKRCDYLIGHLLYVQASFVSVHWYTNLSSRTNLGRCCLCATALSRRHTPRPSTTSESRIKATRAFARNVMITSLLKSAVKSTKSDCRYRLSSYKTFAAASSWLLRWSGSTRRLATVMPSSQWTS